MDHMDHQMDHFEDIWNFAEEIGSKLAEQTDYEIIKAIIDELQKNIDYKDDIAKQGQVIGEIIYYICQLTRKQGINSAKALNIAIEKRNA